MRTKLGDFPEESACVRRKNLHHWISPTYLFIQINALLKWHCNCFMLKVGHLIVVILTGGNEMKIVKMALVALLASVSLTANATLITFTGESSGNPGNGYTVQGVQFSDTIGSDLQVADWGIQSHGTGLAVFGDDASRLRMNFGGVYNSLSMEFGNDDACCSNAGDLALLRLFLGGSQVGQTTVLMNRDDVMNQSIGITGIAFDAAEFAYVDANLNAINLIEIVDNINFDGGRQLPEPGTMVLLGLGLLGAVKARRRVTA